MDPSERTAAAGLTNVARSVATTLSPTMTGYAFSIAALGAPSFLAGAVKIAYDHTLYRAFRDIRPPEERQARTALP